MDDSGLSAASRDFAANFKGFMGADASPLDGPAWRCDAIHCREGERWLNSKHG